MLRRATAEDIPALCDARKRQLVDERQGFKANDSWMELDLS